MAEPQTTDAWAPEDYNNALAAGFSKSELGDWAAKHGGFSETDLPNELQKINAATPTQTPAPTPQLAPAAAPSPVIPETPPLAPGAYSPEQEQKAMKSTEWIADPERRMRVQQTLKREYANLAIADGITATARETNLKKAFSDYTTAIKKINDDPGASWDKKLLVARKVVDAMWDDPRTGVGDAREQIQAHMLKLAGIKNTEGLGPFFNDAYQAVVNKKITTMQQVLQMGAEEKLTPEGVGEVAKALNMMDKPDERINAEQRALAFQNVRETIGKDMNEVDPITQQAKLSGKQLQKINRIEELLLGQIASAKGDVDKVSKIVSSQNVDELIESIYPQHERHLDNISRGMPVNFQGVVVPATVPHEPERQKAYKDFVLAPPTVTITKDGKTQAGIMDKEVWKQAVDMLLASPDQAENFKDKFGQDPTYILRAIAPIAPPPGYNVPVVPAAAEQLQGVAGSFFGLPLPALVQGQAAPATSGTAEMAPKTFLGANPPHEYLQQLGSHVIKSVIGEMPHPTAKQPEEYIRDFFGVGKKKPAEEAKK